MVGQIRVSIYSASLIQFYVLNFVVNAVPWILYILFSELHWKMSTRISFTNSITIKMNGECVQIVGGFYNNNSYSENAQMTIRCSWMPFFSFPLTGHSFFVLQAVNKIWEYWFIRYRIFVRVWVKSTKWSVCRVLNIDQKAIVYTQRLVDSQM